MAAPKKILVIGGFRIFPCNTGGHMRTGNIVRALARMGHQVKVFTLAGRQEDYRGKDKQHGAYRQDIIEPNLVEYTHLGLGIGLLQAVGRRLGAPRVWQYLMLKHGLVPDVLKRAIDEADVILSDLPWCPPVRKAARKKSWYLLSHNLEYRLLEQGNRLDRLAANWMRRVERQAPCEYKDILACADEDQLYFRQHDVAQKMLVPIVRNGVDPAVYVTTPGTREKIRADLGLVDADHLLIFSGSNFGPNVDALHWLRGFCKDEATFLAQNRIFMLVLGSMSQAFREGALIATGRVPEIQPYFAAGDAGLNPITRGSGANVKLFEYLAAQLPVISTPFGVRGTTLVAGQDYLSFEGHGLKQALQTFVTAYDRAGWRLHAQQVWTRQRATCDVEEIMREVARQLPEFAAD